MYCFPVLLNNNVIVMLMMSMCDSLLSVDVGMVTPLPFITSDDFWKRILDFRHVLVRMPVSIPTASESVYWTVWFIPPLHLYFPPDV